MPNPTTRPRWAAAKVEVVEAGAFRRDFEALVGHKVAAPTFYRLLQQAGWRKVMPRPSHPKKDSASEAAFKKFEAEVASLGARGGRTPTVLSMDEGRFGCLSEQADCWAPRSIRPTVPRQVVRPVVVCVRSR